MFWCPACRLLAPGSMVFELLPYKWEWANLSMLYYNITQSVGDIHHFAWRPQHYKWAKFRVSGGDIELSLPRSAHSSCLATLHSTCGTDAWNLMVEGCVLVRCWVVLGVLS